MHLQTEPFPCTITYALLSKINKFGHFDPKLCVTFEPDLYRSLKEFLCLQQHDQVSSVKATH